MPEKRNLKEERFVLVQGFRGLDPWSLGSVVSGLCESEHHGGRA
jgi:hypothetical protein